MIATVNYLSSSPWCQFSWTNSPQAASPAPCAPPPPAVERLWIAAPTTLASIVIVLDIVFTCIRSVRSTPITPQPAETGEAEKWGQGASYSQLYLNVFLLDIVIWHNAMIAYGRRKVGAWKHSQRIPLFPRHTLTHGTHHLYFAK